jgi:hypothetical protein
MPGGAQTVTPGPGSIQLQPAFMSVASATPWASVSPDETSSADNGTALGPDGDPQAPIPSAANITNKAHARLADVGNGFRLPQCRWVSAGGLASCAGHGARCGTDDP